MTFFVPSYVLLSHSRSCSSSLLAGRYFCTPEALFFDLTWGGLVWGLFFYEPGDFCLCICEGCYLVPVWRFVLCVQLRPFQSPTEDCSMYLPSEHLFILPTWWLNFMSVWGLPFILPGGLFMFAIISHNKSYNFATSWLFIAPAKGLDIAHAWDLLYVPIQFGPICWQNKQKTSFLAIAVYLSWYFQWELNILPIGGKFLRICSFCSYEDFVPI